MLEYCALEHYHTANDITAVRFVCLLKRSLRSETHLETLKQNAQARPGSQTISQSMLALWFMEIKLKDLPVYFYCLDKYCHLFLCVECLNENVACTQNGQCCEGQCTYGRCKAAVTEGQPGTFCDRHEDCVGDVCCVRYVSVLKVRYIFKNCSDRA